VSNGAPERRQPALQFILERLDPVLYVFGAVPYLAKVAVHPPHHGFATVAQLPRHGEQADWRALVEGCSRAVQYVCRNILDRISPGFQPARAATMSSSLRKSVSIVSSPVRYEGKSSRLGGRSASNT